MLQRGDRHMAIDHLPAVETCLERFRHRCLDGTVKTRRHLPDIGFQSKCIACPFGSGLDTQADGGQEWIGLSIGVVTGV